MNQPVLEPGPPHRGRSGSPNLSSLARTLRARERGPPFSQQPITGRHEFEQVQLISGDHPAVFRHSNLAAVRREVLNPGHLHALSPDLMRMRGGKPERKFSSDQDSVKPQAGHARGDRCYWEGQQRRSH